MKRVVEGRGSNWLCDRVFVGRELEALPPTGVFTPANLGGDLLLVAGGSGIRPTLRSIALASS